MKRVLVAALAVGLVGCAQQVSPPPGPAVAGGYTYDRYARNAEAWGYPNPIYKNWTTEQLQKRRLDLYALVPLARSPNEVPAYIYSGMALPRQDEIIAQENVAGRIDLFIRPRIESRPSVVDLKAARLAESRL